MDLICRTCLVEGLPMKSITDNNLLDKIKTVSAISIELENLPRNICLFCIDNINGYFEFREKIIKNERILKEKWVVKEEIFVEGLNNISESSDISTENLKNGDHNYVSCVKEEFISCSDEGLNESWETNEYYSDEINLNNDLKTDVNIDVIVQNNEVKCKVIPPCERNQQKGLIKSACPYCNKILERQFYIDHVKTHLLPDEAQIEFLFCYKCKFKTTRKSELEEHKRNHNDKSKFLCSECGQIFSSKRVYNNHMETVHMLTIVNGQISCKRCDFKTTDENESKEHKKTHVERVICNVCGKNVTKSNFHHHVSKHTGKTKTCDVCLKEVKISGFWSHYSLHVKEERTCEICNRSFTTRGTYRNHRKLHREMKMHPCPLCDKEFKSKKALTTHSHHHTGARPHPCDFCPKRFTSHWALVTHRRQHTNERPYACELCPMAFPQRVSLRTHMKSKHNKILETPKYKTG